MKNKKIYTYMLVVALIISLVSSIMVRTNAGVNNKPVFNVEVTATPNPAKVGQDITINGIIRPQPFEVEIPKKEVVLVLDVSGSMSGNRITKLKEAANNFINGMRTVQGLQIGIVAYSSEAVINPNGKNGNKNVTSIDLSGSHQIPNYISVSSGFLPITDTRLNGMINNLEALGGTNAGEGLRKAQFLFNNGIAGVNKTIVFMSDGEPTFYSIRPNSNRSYYTAIDNTNPTIAGPGSSNTSQTIGYATTIGDLIKSNVNNVFSIGYELGNANSSGNVIMKEIHRAMGGLDSNFFATSQGAIDSVLQQIATTIRDTYTISNINLNANFTNGITLDVGGNVVSIDDINYEKVSESNGKARYEASDVPFSFSVKGSQELSNYNIFEESTITFPWNGEILSVDIPNTPITINEDGEAPIIDAQLKSSNNVIATADEVVNVEYTITPREFDYMLNTSPVSVGDEIEEAIFLVDLSQAMNNNDILTYVGRWIENVLVNSSDLKKNGTKFGMIGYADESIYPDDNKEDYYKLFDIKKDKNILKQFISNNNGLLNATEIASRNIGAAIRDADDLFTTQGDPDVGKAIILISSGKVNYSQADINDIREKGYKIISLYLDLQDEAQDTTNNIKFKTLHNELLGSEENYFVSEEKGKNYNSIKLDMDKILLSLLAGTTNSAHDPYIFNNVKLNFDLNGNFQVVSGLVSSGAGYVYNVPEIIYNATSRNDDGTYSYTAKPLDISFKIRAAVGRSGDLNFGLNPSSGSQEYENNEFRNYISYTKLDKSVTKKPINTPIISIRSTDLEHGVYEGISNNPPIYTGDAREFAKGSNVTMGALFNTIRNESNISLTVSPKLIVNDEVKIYEVTSNGDLQFISNMTLSNDVYSYRLNDTAGKEILVLYNTTVPEEVGTYTNTIYVGTESKDAVIKVKDEGLPDLF